MVSEPKNVDVKAAALVTLLSFLWGGNPIAIKIGLADAPPIRQAWMRFILGGLTVLAWAWAYSRMAPWTIPRPSVSAYRSASASIVDGGTRPRSMMW